MSHTSPYPRFFRYSLVAIVIGLSLFLRLTSLTKIPDKIFDEVYFPVFAQDYLTQTDFFDAHPPLGKLIIASGIAIFGNNPLGWRVMNAIFGTLLLLVVYGFTLDLTKNWRAAFLALLLVAIEPMALVESRVGLINVYLALFSLLGLWFFWRWYQEKRTWDFTIAMVAFGAASAVKWIGLGALGAALVFWLFSFFKHEKGPRLAWYHWLIFLLIPVIYFLTFIPDLIRGQDIWWWHRSAFGYHAHLNATHPYGSSWWSWAIMLRPIWLYYKNPIAGKVIGIVELGNIVTWISGLFALLFVFFTYFSPVKESKRPYHLFLLLTYFSLYLPWIFIGRVKFIYHYFVPVLILLILLATVINDELFSHPSRKWAGYILLLAAGLFFAYFLPLLLGIPIPQGFYQQHMWLKSWI